MGLKRNLGHVPFVFSRIKVIIPFPSTIFCNLCDKNIVFDDILDNGGYLDEQKDFGFSSFLFYLQ